jgi:hypothetical protein
VRLGEVTRKAIEHRSPRGVGLAEPGEDQIGDQVVREELATLHGPEWVALALSFA